MTPPAAAPSSTESSAVFRELLDGVLAALSDVSLLLRSIDDHMFRDVSLDPCFGASLGGHVRHILDHARALADAAESGRAAYEHRERGSMAEHDRAAALDTISTLAGRLQALVLIDGTRHIAVEVMPAPGRPVRLVASTVEREAAFVMSHTIHHIAIMRQLVARAGKDRCSGIGLAPGTPRFTDGNGSCAH